jgi:hypothetical protein
MHVRFEQLPERLLQRGDDGHMRSVCIRVVHVVRQRGRHVHGVCGRASLLRRWVLHADDLRRERLQLWLGERRLRRNAQLRHMQYGRLLHLELRRQRLSVHEHGVGGGMPICGLRLQLLRLRRHDGTLRRQGELRDGRLLQLAHLLPPVEAKEESPANGKATFGEA